MRFPFARIFLVLLVLLAASLACNLPSSGSSRPPTAVPMSDQELQQLEENMKATLQASSGEITLTLTEQQINSIISAKMASQKSQIISEPAVKLTNGTMQVFGKLTQSGITLDTTIILKPGVDSAGNPNLEVTDIKMGSFPVPDELKNQIGNLVDQAFHEYLTGQNQGFKATKITIDEGKMTVTGSIQQP
jgi:uncharacterized protein YpmS